jgi:hypothetical protein
MKKIIACILLVAGMACCALAQDPMTFEERLTDLWKDKKYTELQTLLDEKTSVNPPDVVALYCSKFFYLFIQPDKAKALNAVTKLKVLAEATADSDFVAFANGELAEVQGIPEAEFVQPTPEVLLALHVQFEDKYPNLAMGARLKKYKNP